MQGCGVRKRLRPCRYRSAFRHLVEHGANRCCNLFRRGFYGFRCNALHFVKAAENCAILSYPQFA